MKTKIIITAVLLALVAGCKQEPRIIYRPAYEPPRSAVDEITANIERSQAEFHKRWAESQTLQAQQDLVNAQQDLVKAQQESARAQKEIADELWRTRMGIK